MADELKASLSAKAFIKLLLHASKYPHCSVNGLLLASTSNHTSEPGSKSSHGSVKLVDAIPLFHSSLTLAPMMEMALTQVDVYCRAHNLVIAGYYQANENLDNNRPVGVAIRLADKIKETFDDTSLLMIDNRKLCQVSEESYILHSCADGKWKASNKGINVMSSEYTQKTAASLIEQRAYRDLIDFDNYLDDITLDWLNADINEQIEQN